ncbi:hypothetical protein OESDEN_23002 [Oesophagostomum dentatum]|uniref:Uncharacterized protein n=1 Tax=Oesophagostomum dentatum TaxID=61180 RepID=A0A0B1RWC8_OESDE|nr:hypothetical protein OESDEN_23002 [Oesophagostomum dentatum]
MLLLLLKHQSQSQHHLRQDHWSRRSVHHIRHHQGQETLQELEDQGTLQELEDHATTKTASCIPSTPIAIYSHWPNSDFPTINAEF